MTLLGCRDKVPNGLTLVMDKASGQLPSFAGKHYNEIRHHYHPLTFFLKCLSCTEPFLLISFIQYVLLLCLCVLFSTLFCIYSLIWFSKWSFIWPLHFEAIKEILFSSICVRCPYHSVINLTSVPIVISCWMFWF